MWFRVHFNDFDNFRNGDKNVCRRLEHVFAFIRLEKIIFQSTQYLFSHVINLRCAHFITGNAFAAFTVEFTRKKKMAKQLDESQISQFPFFFAFRYLQSHQQQRVCPVFAHWWWMAAQITITSQALLHRFIYTLELRWAHCKCITCQHTATTDN